MYAEGSAYQEEMTAVGPLGKIEAKVPGPGHFWPTHLGAPPVSQVILSPRAPKGPQVIDVPIDEALLAAGDHNGSTFYEHVRFLNVVREGGVPEVTLRDGMRAVEIGMAAQEAAATGRAVTLGQPMTQPQQAMSRNGATG